MPASRKLQSKRKRAAAASSKKKGAKRAAAASSKKKGAKRVSKKSKKAPASKLAVKKLTKKVDAMALLMASAAAAAAAAAGTEAPKRTIIIAGPTEAQKRLQNAVEVQKRLMMEKQMKNAAMSAAAMAAVMAASAAERAQQQLKNAAAAAAAADLVVAQKRLQNASVPTTGASASQEAAAALVAARLAKLHVERAAENAARQHIKNAEAAAKVAAVATAAVAAAAAATLQPIILREEAPPTDEAHRVVIKYCREGGGGWDAVKDLPLTEGRSVFVRDLLQHEANINKLFTQTISELEVVKEKYKRNTNVNNLAKFAKNIEYKTATKTLLFQVLSWLHHCNSIKQMKQELNRLFLGIKTVPMDGWCFYHSVISALENDSMREKAIELNREVVLWLNNNRHNRVCNNETILERYNLNLSKTPIPIYDDTLGLGPSRILDFDQYLFYSNMTTKTMDPVVWPELAIVGFAIANLKKIQLVIYSDSGKLVASYAPPPFSSTPTKTVSLWHSNKNHFDLLVPRV